MTDDAKRVHDNENTAARSIREVRSTRSSQKASTVPDEKDGPLQKVRTAIVVLGLQGPEASITTRVLNILGASLPRQVINTPIAQGGAEWESARLSEYNERLLKDLEATAHDWRPFDLTHLSMRDRTRLEDDWVEIIGDEFDHKSIPVIKDPRLSRMSDAFLKAIEASGAETISIIPLRNPLDAIESLLESPEWPSDCDRIDAALLWLTTMLQVEKATRSRPHAVLAYEDLLSQPVETLDRLAAKVDLPGLRDPESAQKDLLELIEPVSGHQKHQASDVALDPELRGWVSDAYSALRWIASGIDVERARAELDEIRAEFNKAMPLLMRSADLRREALDRAERSATVSEDLHRLTATHSEMKSAHEDERKTMRLELEHLRAENERLQGALEQEKVDKAVLAQKGRELDDAIAIRSTSIESLQSRIAHLLDEQSALDNRVESAKAAASKDLSAMETKHSRELSDRDAELATLQKQLAAREEDARVSQARFTQSQAEIDDLRSEIEQAERDRADHSIEMEALKKRALKLHRSNRDRKSQIKELKQERKSLSDQIAAFEIEKQKLEAERLSLTERARRSEERLRESEGIRLDDARRSRDKIARIRESYQSSTSWRITAPVRGIMNFFKRPTSEHQYTPQGPSLLTRGKQKTQRLVKAVQQRVLKQEPRPEPVPLGELGHRHKRVQTGPLQTTNALQLAPGSVPEISIIIPVYNNIEYTRACIESVIRIGSSYPFEILVADDGSSDETEAELSSLKDITYIRSETNLGFLRNCNHAVQHAKGRYIVFLNNDTTVTLGWLDALRETFEEHDDVGLVGSKLIYPDGRLQEAGGIVWDDGSGWNWGRLSDPDHPQFNFVRDVDYVSGASIMIEKEAFERLGRFDERYEMAYYEDTDLAMSVRASGRRVLYQPQSEVIHHEGISSGTDLESGQKQYQVSNAKLFYEKWQDELSSNLENASDPLKASDRTVKSHILIIDECTPTPDQDSGSIDMFNMIKILISLGHRVHFIPQSNFDFFGDYTRTLQRLGVECIYTPFYKTVEEFLSERGDIFSHVFLVRVTAAREHLQTVKTYCPSAKRVFYTVDLHHLREKREAELLDDNELREIAAATEASEISLMKDVDTTIVLSGAEKQMLEDRGVSGLITIPLIREIERPTEAPFARRFGALFLGGYQHTPNVDAVKWLVKDIWPVVRKLTKERGLASVPLHIYGSRMPDSFHNFAAEDIHVHGFAEDLREIYNSVRLSVAPLRFGAGLKGKLATSFIYGVPVVGTDIAFEGVNNATLLEGSSSPEEIDMIAAQIVEFHFMQEKWQRIRSQSIDYANNQYSIGGVTKRIIKALGEVKS